MKRRSIFSGLVLFIVGAATGLAQTTMWIGASGGVWSLGTNWSNGSPIAADTVVFSSVVTTTVDSAFTFTNLEFTGGAVVLNSSSGSLSASNGIFYGGGTSVAINVPIIGTGNLWLNGGTGTVTLNPGSSGANTYSGSTEVYAGGTLSDGAANSYSANSILYVGSSTPSSVLVNFNESIASLADVAGGPGSVVIASGATLDLVGGYTGSFSGVISGAGNLEKDNTGTLMLTGANTYTGTTVINGAGGTVIEIGNGGATGSIASNSVSGTGTLAFDLSSNYTYAGTLSGALQVAQSGTGITTLTGNNTYTGATTISAGTLQAGSTSAFGNSAATLVINGTGTLDLNGFSNSINAVQSTSTTSTISLSAGATLTLRDIDANSSTTFAGAITGTGSLNTSVYQLNITGNNNTYSGGTTITSGTFIANNSSPSGSATGTGPITIASGGSLLLGQASLNGYINPGSAITDNGALQFFRTDSIANVISNNISGTGTVSQDGSGITELSGTNTYSGVTTVFNGTLEAGSTSAFGGATGKSQIAFTFQGTLLLNGFDNTVGSITGSATSGGINLGANTLTINDSTSNTNFAPVISGVGGSLVFGGQTMILTGSNTYTGATDINSGLILVANPSGYGLGTGPVNIGPSSTLQIGANSTAGAINPTSSVTDNGILAISLTSAVSMPNTVTGTGGVNLLASGTITFPTANTYSGTTQIEAGTLIADNTSGSAIGTGPIYISPGATLQLGNGDINGLINGPSAVTDNGTLTFAKVNTITFTNNISGTGGVSQIDGGTSILEGSNTYSGSTQVVSGTLQAGSTSAFGGATGLSPVVFTSGTLNLNGFSNTVGSISGGAGNAIQLGIGTLTMANPAANTTFGGMISGVGGSLVFAGTSLDLQGANSYTGTTTVSSGSLVADNPTGSATGTSNITVANLATLEIGNDDTAGSVAATSIVNNGTVDFARTDNISFGSNISGTGTVVLQEFGGTVTLTGTNTYSGSTQIISSVLADGAASAFSPASSIQLGSGSSLVVGFNDAVGDLENGDGAGTVTLAPGTALTINVGNAALSPFTGTISGLGGLVINTNLAMGLSQGLAGASTYSGGTTVASGELFVGSSTVGAPGSITSGPVGTETLTFSAGTELSPAVSDITLANAIVLNGTGGIDNDDGLSYGLTLSGPISGTNGFAWCTAGIFTLLNSNTFEGGVDMREGTLLLGSDTAAGTGTITLDTGTTIDANGSGVTRLIPNAINVTGTTIQIGTGSDNQLTFSGVISGSGPSVVTIDSGPSGSVTLSSTNTIAGSGTTFDVTGGGTVNAANSSAFGASGNIVALQGGATLNVMGGVTISNQLASSGTANVLAGSGTLGSPVTVDSTLALSPIASPGGGPGNLTFTSPLIFATGGTIDFSIYDADGASGAGYSLITADGGAIFTASANTLTFNLISVNFSGGSAAALNFNPTNSYSWTIINAGGSGLTGFSASQFNLNTSGFTNGTGVGSFSFVEVGNSLDLNFTPVPEPSTWAMLGIGFCAVVPFALRRRRLPRA